MPELALSPGEALPESEDESESGDTSRLPADARSSEDLGFRNDYDG